MIDKQEARSIDKGNHLKFSVSKDIKIAAIISVISILLALIFAIIITKLITKPISMCVNIANEIAQGRTDVKINISSNDETGVLANAMQKMIQSIKIIYEDLIVLVQKTIEGQMTYRLDSTKHRGDFKKIMQGVNEMLDTIFKPFDETLTVLEKVSKKDLTVRVINN